MRVSLDLIKTFMVILIVSVAMTACTSSDEKDENETTITTFLEKEFTGPDEELKSALNEEGAFPPALEAYVDEHYTPLVHDVEKMINENQILVFLRMADANGYQLNPGSMEIKKVEDHAYEYEVEVEYSKGEDHHTAKVQGLINLNEEGKIVTIRSRDDGGLLEKLAE
ncbi:hypothetical protein [Bacillus sp. KH172YL63]|uniref:hypothetical protein n=1 Tax=Bacillus sp. KH172YL63 TaxID=2709784 RepID=UPI0013E4B1EA|nr:hypothetical protein [Bacillus sp. KH172YL63]BCB04038.1 hypothetical protein KH172YL63_21710 [Bacillus sp. KH172YL63]